MYSEDSFFNLSVAGRAGLALLSLMLAVAVLLLASRAFIWINRRLGGAHMAVRVVARLVVALLAFWLFEWLSPQLYYHYYLMIFEGLPWQIVIKTPPGPGALVELLTFKDKTALSHHSRGLLGWALIVVALFWRQPKHGQPERMS